MSHVQRNHPPVKFSSLPDKSVTVSGDPEHPTITNNTNRTVIGYIIRRQELMADGELQPKDTVVHNAIYPRQRGRKDPITIAAQSTGTVQTPGSGGTGAGITTTSQGAVGIGAVYLDAVIFEDGEYTGPDPVDLMPIVAEANNRQREALSAIVSNRKTRNLNLQETLKEQAAKNPNSNGHADQLIAMNFRELAAAPDPYATAEMWLSHTPILHPSRDYKKGATK